MPAPENPVIRLLLLILTISVTDALGQPSSLQIDISNVQKNSGKIVVDLYKDKSSWLKTPFKKITLATDGTTKTASFDVPQGRYAISIYQDVNDNGELDQNFLGIPKEPVGFGNNYKPFGKPKFQSASIDYNAKSKPDVIKLFSAF